MGTCLQQTRSSPSSLLALATALALSLGMPAPAQAQEDVPFITTPDHVTLAMLQMALVGPQDYVVDLGSGDGRIVITAARRFGARGLGVEIVGDLVRKSRDNARAAGVAERAEFAEQDLFATDLGRATVVTMYLLPSVNLQLRPRLLALPAGTRVVSHDWDMGDWRPDQSQRLAVPNKAVGLEKSSQLHLWVVPAQVQGPWCASSGARLQVEQRFQAFSATLWPASSQASGQVPAAVLDGRISGNTLRAEGAFGAVLQATPQGLTLVSADAAGQAYAGQAFSRCR